MTLRSGFRVAVAMGLQLALAHATASGLTRLWCGVRLGWLDLPITVLSVLLVTAAALSIVWLIVWATGLHRTTAATRDLARIRRVFFAMILLGYAGLTTLIVYHEFRPSLRWLWGLAPATLAACTWLAIRSPAASFGRRQLAFQTLAFTCLGTTSWAILGPQTPTTSRAAQLGAGFLLAPVACLAVLLLIRKADRPRAIAGPVAAVVAFLLVVLASVTLPASRTSWYATTGGPSATTRSTLPNIILIVLDTVSARHLELFGYDHPTMPRLTRFAREDCDVVMPITAVAASTLPAFGSMLTGMWPSVHGAHAPACDDPGPWRYGDPLRDDLPTLPEFLARKGYRCGAVASNYAVLNGFGLQRGFHDFDARPGDVFLARRLGWVHATQTMNVNPSAWLRSHLPEFIRRYTISFDRLRPPYRRADDINRDALAWLARHGDGPHFLMINYLDAHEPYLPVSAEHELAGTRPDWVGFPDKIWYSYFYHRTPFPDDLVAFLRRMYDTALGDLDLELGQLVDELRRRPDFDRTLLVITADHGEEFMEHRVMRHGLTAYEPAVSVPLIVRWPAAWKSRCQAIAPAFQHVDLMPTIAALLNDPSPPATQGRAWGAGRDYALCEVYADARGTPWVRGDAWTVRTGDLKHFTLSDGTEELYDLASDPDEQRNLTARHPEFVRQVKRVLAERAGWASRQRNAPRRGADESGLQSLGYLH